MTINENEEAVDGHCKNFFIIPNYCWDSFSRFFVFASGALQFSRKHPFALWIGAMLYIFAGSMLANALLGEPMLTPLKNNNQLLLATSVWWGEPK